MWILVAAVSFLVLFAGQPPAGAELYQFIDRDGTAHLTNVPTDPRYKRIDLESGKIRPRLSQHELNRTIARYSRKHGIHPALLRAVIKAESDFNPSAVSKAGALGLMQLMPETAMSLQVRDPFDPEQNIRGGATYLRRLLDRFQGNLPLALAAYNAGESVVNRYMALPPIRETRRYVARVLRYYRNYLVRDSSATMSRPSFKQTLRPAATFPDKPQD